MTKKSNFITPNDVAAALGLTADHIRKLILAGKIKAEKLGRNWIINKKSITGLKRQRFPRQVKESSNVDTSNQR